MLMFGAAVGTGLRLELIVGPREGEDVNGQTLAPCADEVCAAQGVQADAPGEDENVLAKQSLHKEAPNDEPDRPGGHIAQALCPVDAA